MFSINDDKGVPIPPTLLPSQVHVNTLIRDEFVPGCQPFHGSYLCSSGLWRLVLDDRRALLSVHAPHKCYLRQVFITGRGSHDPSFVSLITAIVYLPPSTHLYKQPNTFSKSFYLSVLLKCDEIHLPFFP